MTRTHTHRRRPVARRQSQGGFSMLELSLALLISALIGIAAQAELIRARNMESGELQGQILKSLEDATQNYIFENYTAHQFLNSVTKGTKTLPGGTALGETMHPRIEDLRDLGYLPSSFSPLAMLNDGAYQVEIERVPAGCAPAACQITGKVYIDRPITRTGTTELNGPAIGRILAKVGGNAATSLPSAPGTLYGVNGSETPNPVAGTPAGIVASRVGYDSTWLTQFVRMADTRDPNLQGAFTVAGATTLNSTLAVSGAGTFNSTIQATGSIKSKDSVAAEDAASCLRAALQSNGEITSRSVACVQRFLVDPNAGTATVKDATGADRVELNGSTGAVAIKNAGGAVTVTHDGVSGRSTSNLINVVTSATANSSCSSYLEGDLARDAAADGTVLVCRSGSWRRPGLPIATAGTSCSGAGVMGVDSSSRGLICRNSTWRLMNDRVTSVVPVATTSGSGAGVIPAPTCGAGGTADLLVMPLETGADYGGLPPRNRYTMKVTWTGAGWNVNPVLVDNFGGSSSVSYDGVAYQFAWVASTLCNYGEGN